MLQEVQVQVLVVISRQWGRLAGRRQDRQAVPQGYAAADVTVLTVLRGHSSKEGPVILELPAGPELKAAIALVGRLAGATMPLVVAGVEVITVVVEELAITQAAAAAVVRIMSSGRLTPPA